MPEHADVDGGQESSAEHCARRFEAWQEVAGMTADLEEAKRGIEVAFLGSLEEGGAYAVAPG